MRRRWDATHVDSEGSDARSARTSSDNATNELVRQVSDGLKPHYRALMKKAQKTEIDAYSLAYGRAVAQVAKAHRTSEDMTKFLYRNELQAIMSRVTT